MCLKAGLKFQDKKNKIMPGQWHTNLQNLFDNKFQEVEFSFLHVTDDNYVTKRRRIADVCVDETVHSMKQTNWQV